MKKLLSRLFVLCFIIFSIAVMISSFRSTEETYVCSGDLIEHNKSTRNINVKFEVQNQYSGIPWNDYHWTYVQMIDNAPYVFYSSELGDSNKGFTRYGELHWIETVWGNKLKVWATNNDRFLSFDFTTKILEIKVWDNSGNTRLADYNLVCREIK
jgi:hypothetical protein